MDFIDYLEGVGVKFARRYVITITLLIYDYSQRGEIIYAQKIHQLIGGGKKTTSDRIRELVDYGIITKRDIMTGYQKVKLLELTERGVSLARIFLQLREFDL